jgi:hypothetical protein
MAGYVYFNRSRNSLAVSVITQWCAAREKRTFSFFFLPLILNAKELGLGVKREGFEREKHIHTRNLKR